MGRLIFTILIIGLAAFGSAPESKAQAADPDGYPGNYDKDGVSMMNSGGTTVAKGNEQFAGVGHCSVYTFGDKDYIFMHGYDKDQDYRSKLLVRELKWSDDGWPVVVL